MKLFVAIASTYKEKKTPETGIKQYTKINAREANLLKEETAHLLESQNIVKAATKLLKVRAKLDGTKMPSDMADKLRKEFDGVKINVSSGKKVLTELLDRHTSEVKRRKQTIRQIQGRIRENSASIKKLTK